VSEEHAGEVLTLKDIEAARRAHRRSLRATINERVARVVDFLPHPAQPAQPAPMPKPPLTSARPRLRVYREGDL
jgi:putative transposase